MSLSPGMRRVPLKDRAAFNAVYAAEHVFKRSPRLKRAHARMHDRIVAGVRAQGPGRVFEVQRRPGLTPEQFRKEHLAKGIPVVIPNGAAEWPLMSKWSFDYFRDTYGEETIKLVQRDGLTDDDVRFEREYSEEIKFGDFLDNVLDGGRKYMRFSPLLEQFPDLLRDLDYGFFRRMIGPWWGQAFQLFIGGTTTITPFHNAMSPFFFTMVSGSKRWSLVPNQYLAVMNPPADTEQYNHSDVALDLSNDDEFPGIDSIDTFRADIETGDLLFVPSWMWHAVFNETPTIGIRCGFMQVREAIRQAPTLAGGRMLFGDPNIFRWLYYSYIKTDLPDRDDLLLTSRMFTNAGEEPGQVSRPERVPVAAGDPVRDQG